MNRKARFVKEKIKVFLHSNRMRLLLWAVGTLWGGLGCCYLFDIAGFAKQENGVGFTQSALNPLAFGLVGYFLWKQKEQYRQLDGKCRRKRLCFSYGVSLLLALSFLLGYQMRMLGNTLPGVWGKGLILFMAMGLALAWLPLMNLWFVWLEHWRENGRKREVSAKTARRSFWISWLVIFAGWLPVFLAYYPAIMSYDFHRQSQEAYKGFLWFNDHHPLIHTFLIRSFFQLGEAIGSMEVGMAVFSLCQMAVLSVVLAYSCNCICRMTGRVLPSGGMAVIYALLPIHPVLAMSMTKDILFSAFFLLLVLLLWEQKRFWMRSNRDSTKDTCKNLGFGAALVLTGILTMLFRNNALHAFAIFAVIYVILFARKQRVYMTIVCLCILLGGIGCKSGIRSAMDAGTGSKMEMYSVFVQQFARVGQRQAEQLTEEEWALIDYYVPDEAWENYNPPLSDTIKAYITVTSYQSWKDDIPGMLRDWVKIGLRYPNEYIDAFLAITSGYWFLDDVSHAEVLGYGEDTNLGLLYTFNASESDVFEGIESNSYFPALLSVYQKIVNGNSYYGWPVVSILFKPAFYSWLLFLAMVSYAYLGETKKFPMSILVGLYLLTLFFGPVVNMRYAYPIMLAVPVLMAYVFQREDFI